MKLVTFIRTEAFDPADGAAPAMPLGGIGAPVRGEAGGAPSFFGEEVGLLSGDGTVVLPIAQAGISYPDMNTLIADHLPQEMEALRRVSAALDTAAERMHAAMDSGAQKAPWADAADEGQAAGSAAGADPVDPAQPGGQQMQDCREGTLSFPGLLVGKEAKLLSPIPHPLQDVICLGLNYTEHAAEAAAYSQEAFTSKDRYPVYFSKRVDRSPGDGEPVPAYEGLVDSLDYEAELAVIIGRDAKNVAPEEAKDYIFGYTVLNDLSARNLQTRHTQWYLGKSLDGYTPMGPCIVTADAFAFPPKLHIRSTVNGEVRQDSTTDMLIFGIDHIIAELSAGMTLRAGTIISTGTPRGVGMGFDPPRFLKAGDVVACEIEGIGTLTNVVKAGS